MVHELKNKWDQNKNQRRNPRQAVFGSFQSGKRQEVL